MDKRVLSFFVMDDSKIVDHFETCFQKEEELYDTINNLWDKYIENLTGYNFYTKRKDRDISCIIEELLDTGYYVHNSFNIRCVYTLHCT